MKRDPYFDGIKSQLDTLLDPRSFVGRAPEQVDAFLRDWVEPALADEEFRRRVLGADRTRGTEPAAGNL